MVGFPHSEILGSKLIRSSPRLIAAYYVLHRLHTPRHPLDALKTLDRSHYQCPQYHKSHPLLYGQDLHHRADVLYPTHHCIGLIGQIKKPKFTWLAASSLGCRVKQSNKPSLYDVERSGSRDARRRQLPNLLSVCDVTLYTNRRMVEPDGIEPTTSCLQSTRSPN